MIRKSTIEKQQLIEKLKTLDQKFKFNNSAWNDAIKAAFSNSGSFDFINLVHSNPNTARKLVSEFNIKN